VEDAAMMLQVVAGYDTLDPTTSDVPVPDYRRALGAPTARLRLGVPRAALFNKLDPDVEAAIDTALGVLRTLTADTTEVVLPPTGNPALVWGPEAYAYHAPWITASPELYQPGTRQTLERSASASASEYAQAVHDVQVARRTIAALFSTVDLLISPTMRTPAPPLEAPGGGGGNNNAVFDIFGLPTISIPCGFSRDGLPIGLQVSGAPWAESTVLTLAHAYEQATNWQRRPPL
jgi:aspartyl-tRNA(Asn)/glutamyl-tRNA(Gln) amidotransferase subunit A